MCPGFITEITPTLRWLHRGYYCNQVMEMNVKWYYTWWGNRKELLYLVKPAGVHWFGKRVQSWLPTVSDCSAIDAIFTFYFFYDLHSQWNFLSCLIILLGILEVLRYNLNLNGSLKTSPNKIQLQTHQAHSLRTKLTLAQNPVSSLKSFLESWNTQNQTQSKRPSKDITKCIPKCKYNASIPVTPNP